VKKWFTFFHSPFCIHKFSWKLAKWQSASSLYVISTVAGQPPIGKPLIGQAKGQLRLTWRSYAGSPQSGEIPRPNGTSSMVAGDFSTQSLNRTKGMIIHNHMKHRSKWQFDTCRSVIAFIKTKSSFKRSCFSPQRNPLPSHPLCPMSSVSAWSTAAAVLWHDGARQAGFSRHFCHDRWRNPGFLCCFPFYLIREGVKAVNPWTPALHTCIPYGHLGNLWMVSFHSAGLSHPSTLFNRKNRVFVNVKMKN